MCSNLLINFLLTLLQIQFAITFQEYDPQFARFVFEHAAAAYSRNPLNCLAKYYGTYILQQGNVSCDHLHDEVFSPNSQRIQVSNDQ
ncbi:unnamed protein product [Brugia timori]|uniref:Uncharacterized protein n=1 Tax=Brugia timori TaxID=42155 RepID=A0A0R3QSZ2_9BILA|nr:unnamed protein product [Brugia timori]